MLTTLRGPVTVSYKKRGSGPPLVLVHGGFSDHDTNWDQVMPFFEQRFTVYAIARRGRGETSATEGHSVEDEIADAVAVIRAVGEPVFLLGHSYGAQVALGASRTGPELVRRLVLYEAPWPQLADGATASLDTLARIGDWDTFASSFFGGVLRVPQKELEELRTSELWPPIVADAKASLGDLHALGKYDFDAARFREVRVPTLLQIGSHSPRELYVTDALAAALPDARIGVLDGQAHEGMTTAPQQYADAVIRFLHE